MGGYFERVKCYSLAACYLLVIYSSLFPMMCEASEGLDVHLLTSTKMKIAFYLSTLIRLFQDFLG